MTFEKAWDRYRTDAPFHQLVDAMIYQIDALHFSPGELREAAVFAEIMHQKRTVATFIPTEKPR